MQVNYIAQPDRQLGNLVITNLSHEIESLNRVVFVSAFVSLQTILRVKDSILALRNAGKAIEFYVGIDLGGTSKEVLNELLSWNITVKFIKNRLFGHTFHPKIYLFEWDKKAEIIVGSNNLTEGGFFNNYESSSNVIFDLPIDVELYNAAKQELNRFINPSGPTVNNLTQDVINSLFELNLIPTETTSRARRDSRLVNNNVTPDQRNEINQIIGVEEIPLPPALPAHLIESLVNNVRRRRGTQRRATTPTQETTQTQIAEEVVETAAFYMTLPTLQGDNIPGEARIPLEAIELASDFWGYPTNYTRTESPRAGSSRVYWNWKPNWRLYNVSNRTNLVQQEVRMYMYENSSDFRFYSRFLVNEGADNGDLVRITRLSESDVEFECVLARQGTPEYAEWILNCTQPVRNSTRRFGFA